MGLYLSGKAEGTHDAFKIVYPCEGTIEVFGDFGGATATLSYSSDGGVTYRDFQADQSGTVGDVVWDANEIKAILFPVGEYRLVIGSGTDESLSLDVSCPAAIDP